MFGITAQSPKELSKGFGRPEVPATLRWDFVFRAVESGWPPNSKCKVLHLCFYKNMKPETSTTGPMHISEWFLSVLRASTPPRCSGSPLASWCLVLGVERVWVAALV